MSELQSKADKLDGKVKGAAGDTVNSDGLANQDKGERATSKVKQGAEDLKDKVIGTLDKLTSE